MVLNSQAIFRSDVGDRIGALAANEEAVTLYRALPQTDRAAFASNLAGALTSQAKFSSEVGDRPVPWPPLRKPSPSTAPSPKPSRPSSPPSWPWR